MCLALLAPARWRASIFYDEGKTEQNHAQHRRRRDAMFVRNFTERAKIG
ncbi:hypothetical protein EPIB1_922 [Tritonibacter mobilis]|nr:hypothetical protein EPIB1_922 [Tritonibacter mobilis]